MQRLVKYFRALVSATLLLLLVPVALLGQSRGDVSIAIGHRPGDTSPNLTIYGTRTNYLQFWIQNDNPLLGIEIDFEFSWSPGFTIDFDTNYGGQGQAVKARGDAVGAWDLLYYEARYFDGVSPESLIIYGVSLFAGLPAHPTPALCYEMKFDVTGTVPSSGVPALMRVDNVIVPPSTIWAFGDALSTYPPTFQGLPNSSIGNPDAPPVTADIDRWYPCGDCDCNDIVNVSDAVYLITYIFAGGPAPCAACP